MSKDKTLSAAKNSKNDETCGRVGEVSRGVAAESWTRRTSPDGDWTENVYDSNRRVVGQMSSDPSCAYGLALDVFGRTVAASNSVALYGYALANCGIATNEAATVGAIQLEVARAVDPYGRITSVARDGMEDSIFYNPTNGTIAVISNAEVCVTYVYTSDLLDGGYTLTLADGTQFTREVSHQSTYLRERVISVTNSSPVATNGWHYGYDALNRPVSRNSDAFAYNARSEVSSATVDGRSATYVYDGIGNLTESSVATGGLPAVATYYYANGLNQYDYASQTGGESMYFGYSASGEITYLNWLALAYDAKSRLVSVGEWVFDEDRYQSGDYDSHDELYSFEPIVSNRYDHLDRRVQKITSAATHTYFYDGWMLIKEIVANTNGTTDVIEYHWGKDLSGTIGGAGGVGGLLYLTVSNSSTHQLYIPWYDAYGNIMGYWDAQGNVVAEYTYDAFGKLVSSSGPMADVFAFRYSTKYFDPETGFYYYGYRYYSPELMRWITRDPIGEEGGVNLYAMCRNRPVEMYDYLGLKWNIRRSGGKFAYAIADSESDTFQGLANIVELDSSDYMKWAHTKDATPLKCKVYLIPNLKVYHKGVRRFYENWSRNVIGNWDDVNERHMAVDVKLGFCVEIKNQISDMDVMNALRTDGIYEYTFTGHGGGGGSVVAEDFDSAIFADRYTPYGIHKLSMEGCATGNDLSLGATKLKGWEVNVARAGVFIGYNGDVRLFTALENRIVRRGTNSN